MTDILFEMHFADAVKDIEASNSILRIHNDSLAIYTPILSKFGYTVDDFNESVQYYTTKPETMKSIYAEIIKRVKAMNDEYTTLAITERKDKNLWSGADTLIIDADSAYTKFDFNIPIMGKGAYEVTANVKFFIDDSTRNPKLSAWITPYDTDTVINKKDAELKKFEETKASIKIYWNNDTLKAQLKGHLIDYDTIVAGNKQHVQISNIYIEYFENDTVDFTKHGIPIATEGVVISDSLVRRHNLNFRNTRRTIAIDSVRRRNRR